ncbi:MAG TPA: aldo/keto reductase [Polyangiales bacterium]|nr:aldo/keto reductase [Polyangiales bacterium]
MLKSGFHLLRDVEVPWLLYGTAWKEERTELLTTQALAAGFVGIDTANQRKHYFEAGVGAALASALASGKRRENLFLQTKFTFLGGQDHRLPYTKQAPIATQVDESMQSSLSHLGTRYVDSYVLHGPSQRSGLGSADWEAWRAMEGLQRAGQARYLGVSNVSLEQLQALQAGASVKPRFVQNRCYAERGWDREVRRFCDEHGLIYQGFSLLTANRRELASTQLKGLAVKLGRSVPELVFRFAIDVGMLPLTGTTSREHMQLDLKCSEFELSAQDVSAIERIAA